MSEGVMYRYGAYLPLSDSTPRITMGEGGTPLVKSNRLGKSLGCEELYFKLEGCNPTGSFKDRGMVVAVAKAMEEGAKAIICASTGNTSASAAAYGARYDLSTVVLIPKGEVASGKLAQAVAYGAKVLTVDAGFDDALALVRRFADSSPVVLVNSVNPHRLEGQKTAAFEIVDQLGDAPDYLFIPVGNAGNITAYWKGFIQYHDTGRANSTPQMMGFQAAGAAPIVKGVPIENPATIASAIRIGNPASWEMAETARDQSGGTIDSVTDDEIMEAYKLLATQEGVFCEPASAASYAGLLKMHRLGLDLAGQSVVCVITGTGLKDREVVTDYVKTQPIGISANLKELESAVMTLTS